ncbi:hypothetical protein NHH03_23475 [Stieleria sp. TO1_6]|uniref:hypothetical protein n=1 Tax=Stieleria tagensis TaxID=2956795 RepID=UPI00209A6E51|nr:hypothetical protein [Stieleria tagensis]MCO8124720.1 hypothetical protein [Stieleria tagensis]
MALSDRDQQQSLFRFDADAMLFLGIGYLVFLGSAIAAVAVRGIMKSQAIRQFQSADEPLPVPLEIDSPLPPSAQTFLGSVATYSLVGQALMEGPAVINAVFLMIGNNLAHLIPIVIAVIGIALQCNTPARLKHLVESVKQATSPSHAALQQRS